MIASDLSSSLNAAIVSADFGAKLVRTGIAVEAVDLIVKCGRNKGFCKWFGDRFEEMNLKRLKKISAFFHPWTLAIEIVSFALVVYGLSVEISGSNEAYRISGLQNSVLNIKAEQLRQKNNALEATMLGVKDTVGDITRERFTGTNLFMVLRRFSGNDKPSGISVILVTRQESELLRASSRLWGNFAQAGWNVVQKTGEIGFDGVTIEAAIEPKSDEDISQAAAFFLLQALTDEKEAVCMMPGSSEIPMNTIIVKIGPKPNAAETAETIDAAHFYINTFKNSKNSDVKKEYDVKRYSEALKVNPASQ